MNSYELFLSPREIINKYPELPFKFNWGTSELGLILECRLVEGYYDRRKRCAMISEQSLITLFEYTNSVLDSQKMVISSNLLRDTRKEIEFTPGEALEAYPGLVHKFGWSVMHLGTLVKCKILDGHYDRRKRGTIIKESSLKKLICYINALIESQKLVEPV